jgi:hypothetical protein
VAVELIVEEIPPSSVPEGFAFRRRLEGADAGGFEKEQAQVTLVYTRGWEHADFAHSLTVHATPATGSALAATEKHPGVPIGLGILSVRAVYHDGLWAPGPGEAEVDVGDGLTIHWERSAAHSITVHAADGTYAVRGPKDTMGMAELLRIAESLNPEG